MRLFIILSAICLLVSCDTAGVRHTGVAPIRQEVGGLVFGVRLRNGYAEAVRRNFMWPPRIREVANKGGAAIEQATGCRVAWLQGDPSVLLAGVDCGPGKRAPRKPRKRTLCEGTVDEPDLTGQSRVSFTCM